MNDARLIMQEALRTGKTEHKAVRASNRKSLFERGEGYLLRYSRERPWMAKLLSRYQLLRLVQQIERHIAKVIISSTIVEMLEHQHSLRLARRDAGPDRGSRPPSPRPSVHHGKSLRRLRDTCTHNGKNRRFRHLNGRLPVEFPSHGGDYQDLPTSTKDEALADVALHS